MCISFEKIDGFFTIHDGARRLVLFCPERFDAINGRIRYLISEKSGITSSNFARITIYSYDSLPMEKALTFHDVIIFIKSVFNKNKNNCYYNIFLEKGLYEDKSNTHFLNECLNIINAIF